MRRQREDLKMLALQNLPTYLCKQCGLYNKTVLDKQAGQVVQELESGGIHLSKTLSVPPSWFTVHAGLLGPCRDPRESTRWYSTVWDVFWDAGFQDFVPTDLLDGRIKLLGYEDGCGLLGWLHRHNIDPDGQARAGDSTYPRSHISTHRVAILQDYYSWQYYREPVSISDCEVLCHTCQWTRNDTSQCFCSGGDGCIPRTVRREALCGNAFGPNGRLNQDWALQEFIEYY